MRDILIRAAKTFLQAFLGVVALGIVNVVDFNSAKALAIAGVAAGISALQNFIAKTV